MHDKILIIESLEQLEQIIQNLLDATSDLQDLEELPKSPNGMLVLNGICMSFIIIGEEAKRIDRYSQKQLLPTYPLIPWKTVMGMRDRIVHGYFEVDIDVIFDTLKNDIPPLLKVIKQIKIDLQKTRSD